VERWIEASRELDLDFFKIESVDDVPWATPDELVTTEIDGRDQHDQKMAAMRAHATQITVDGPFFALSNHIGWQAWGVEHYRLVHGQLGPVDPETGRETDLFAGLEGAPAGWQGDADQSAVG
jgi:N-acetyl-1-D-myo-inositol-2-amino-2-deoxy-alpha-D-glucopyranoside deacetylase